jgi:hypothetical protein
MPDADAAHGCDLFLLSSHQPYYGDRILPAFARNGRRNMDGWGIGSYVTESSGRKDTFPF